MHVKQTFILKGYSNNALRLVFSSALHRFLKEMIWYKIPKKFAPCLCLSTILQDFVGTFVSIILFLLEIQSVFVYFIFYF